MERNELLYKKMSGLDRDDLIKRIVKLLLLDYTDGEYILSGGDGSNNVLQNGRIKWSIKLEYIGDGDEESV